MTGSLSIGSPRSPLPGRRRAVSLDALGGVAEGRLPGGGPLPVVITPAAPGLDLAAWATDHRDVIDRHLATVGGILFRGFGVGDVATLERVLAVLLPKGLVDYVYRSTPRTRVAGRIFTTTEYPPAATIPLHIENAYARVWPLRIVFCCLVAAQTGGATPIGDNRRVYARIPEAIRRRFEEKGVMYVRNFGDVDLPWQEVFQTDDPAAVDEFCRGAGIETRWSADGRLQTRQVCQAVARHPLTGEPVWCNQAHLFHVDAHPPEIRDSLLDLYGEDGLPRHARYGDGSPIDSETVAILHECFRAELVSFPWECGDVMFLDNMLASHAREPFTGPRRVLVSMSEPCSVEGLL